MYIILASHLMPRAHQSTTTISLIIELDCNKACGYLGRLFLSLNLKRVLESSISIYSIMGHKSFERLDPTHFLWVVRITTLQVFIC